MRSDNNMLAWESVSLNKLDDGTTPVYAIHLVTLCREESLTRME